MLSSVLFPCPVILCGVGIGTHSRAELQLVMSPRWDHLPLFLPCGSRSAPPRDSSKLCGIVLLFPIRWCCAAPPWTCVIPRSVVVLGRHPSAFPACPVNQLYMTHNCSIQSRKTEMIFNPSLQVYSSDGLRKEE